MRENRVFKIFKMHIAALTIALGVALSQAQLFSNVHPNSTWPGLRKDNQGSSDLDLFKLFEESESEFEPFLTRHSRIAYNREGCNTERKWVYFKNYEKCGTYHKCEELAPLEYRLETFNCSGEQSFDEKKQECVDSPTCSEITYPDNLGDNSCTWNHQQRAYPNCVDYYVCHWTGQYYTLENRTCPEGRVFSNGLQSCFIKNYWYGQCPQEFIRAPGNKWCDKRGYNQSPDNCADYYRCDKQSGHTLKIFHCPEGTVVDPATTGEMNKIPECIPGTCPENEKELPSDWKCVPDGHLNLNPDDCNGYYKCHACKSDPSKWCYFGVEGCLGGQYFDEILLQCVDSDICPQYLDELPSGDGWHCEKPDQKNPFPNNCAIYYTCINCSKPSGWCYDPVNCPSGEFFDDLKDNCVATSQCPQLWKELPEGDGWNCNADNESHAVPGTHSEFYTCSQCDRPRGWCYTQEECPEGQSYCQNGCVEGRCPEWPALLPDDWKCSENNELVVNPTNCHEYYECVPCPDPSPWCHLPQQCADNEWFDDTAKTCSTNTANMCPQDFSDLPDNTPGWQCSEEGETNVHPDDCGQHYTCLQCKKSPNGWCYIATACPPGETYDDAGKSCVPGRCPQLDPLIPADWQCTNDGELNVVPNDCSKQYTCLSCDDGPWCYKEEQSCEPGQTFDNTNKQCVEGRCPQYPPILPDTWQCQEEGEEHVHPDDCSSYYTCLPCPDSNPWCYSLTSCGIEATYDDTNKMCINEAVCSQLTTRMAFDANCAEEGEMRAHPHDCSQYYTCARVDDEWTPKMGSCAAGQYFYEKTKSCWVGPRCPQDPVELPEGWLCDEDGASHTHPEQCEQYYTCIHVTDRNPPYWSYLNFKCTPGQNFVESVGKCQIGPCSI